MQVNTSQSFSVITFINVMELQPVEINSGKQMSGSRGTALLLLNFMMLSVSDYTEVSNSSINSE